MDKNAINIYDLCRRGTRALGPGLRYAIWTQGCLQRCEGCTTPESRPIVARQLIPSSDLAEDIISRKDIEGITLSGGEPFLQAGPLADMLSKVHEARPELDVIVFSGYPAEVLTWDDAKRLLAKTDVLIDGRFELENKTDRGLRGSSNQSIHFLTDRLLPWKDELENGSRILEVFVKEDRRITIGIPTDAIR